MLATNFRISSLANQLRREMDPNLNFLTHAMRKALVAQAVLNIIIAQDESIVVKPSDVEMLQTEVKEEIIFLTNNTTYFG